MIQALTSDEIVTKVGGRFKLTALIHKRIMELMDGARPLVERGNMTDLEVVIQEILQDKIAIDYAASGLIAPKQKVVMATSTDTAALAGREIIVAVCGGIAAYKAADLVSKLAQAGAGVTVVMTAAARKFVTPLTFATLSGRAVLTGTFAKTDAADPQHIALTERAELMLVAPATSSLIAKVACGICDDLVSLMIAASACPVVFAPAMNNRMWENPIARENRAKLAKVGYRFIEPGEGWLACRNVGAGRLAEVQEIVREVVGMMRALKPVPEKAVAK